MQLHTDSEGDFDQDKRKDTDNCILSRSFSYPFCHGGLDRNHTFRRQRFVLSLTTS